MRLWSMHPVYLDHFGLVALWREGLLAKAVLEGTAIGYRNHPQLLRFYRHEKPVTAINSYLHHVWLEADSRGYRFNRSKYEPCDTVSIPLSVGQLEYEFNHLMKKLIKRTPSKYEEIAAFSGQEIKPHPLFALFDGNIEEWEKV